MTRIIQSALRSLRVAASNNSLRLTAATEPGQSLGRRTVTTSSQTKAPSSSSTSSYVKKPATAPRPYTPYKRAATTSSSSYNSSNSTTTTTAKPAATTTSQSSPTTTTATTTKPSTSAYAENQINPITQPVYTPPPGFGPLPDAPPPSSSTEDGIDWSSSFHGLSTTPFSPEVAAILMKPIPFEDVEVKPDGIIYLPEIKYRRILNTAFGPGGWGMAPRGELSVGEKVVTREYALLVHGRFIAQARGECQFFGNDDGIATAGEGCKSNALMRCCKDLGIASELWDPRYIRDFKKKYVQEIWVEHVVNKKKRQIFVRRGDDPSYPYKRS